MEYADLLNTIARIAVHDVAAAGYDDWLILLLVLGVCQQLYIGISNFLTFISWRKVS